MDFTGGQWVKNRPPNVGDAGDAGLTPGREDPLEKEMATHCSVLAWRIPWTKEPSGCSPWGRKESGMAEPLTTALEQTYVGLGPWRCGDTRDIKQIKLCPGSEELTVQYVHSKQRRVSVGAPTLGH